MAGQEPRGLVIVLTGDGKGKTTAALGMAMRAVGRGMRVAMVQFIKARRTGEHEAAARLGPDLEVHLAGRGFVPPVGQGPVEEHRQAAREALQRVRQFLRAGRHGLVIADEVLMAVHLGLLEPNDVVGLLEDRPAPVHLVLTGRGAPPEVIERADLVTEMRPVKHPFDRGVEAQPGIEF
jgi:cob(I)alamin adenosyltransferase